MNFLAKTVRRLEGKVSELVQRVTLVETKTHWEQDFLQLKEQKDLQVQELQQQIAQLLKKPEATETAAETSPPVPDQFAPSENSPFEEPLDATIAASNDASNIESSNMGLFSPKPDASPSSFDDSAIPSELTELFEPQLKE